MRFAFLICQTIMSRLFYALWPSSEIRAQLAAQRESVVRDYAGRPMRADTLHMTLLFLGDLPELHVPTLLGCGDRVRTPAFTLNIDGRCHFPNPKVAWLGCTDPPVALNDLWMALRKEVDPVFPDHPHRDYRPHISVARDCLHFPQPCAIPTVQWHVEDFVLIDSTLTPGGPVYRVLRHWQLNN